MLTSYAEKTGASQAVLATYAIQQVNTSLPLQLPCHVASDSHWKLR